MLTTILNVPSTPQEWAIWSFAHNLDHQEIVQAIGEQGGPRLTLYQLDPIIPQAMSDWLERNQRSHSEMCGALGLVSADLQRADFRNRNELVAWVGLNYQEHRNARDKLKI